MKHSIVWVSLVFICMGSLAHGQTARGQKHEATSTKPQLPPEQAKQAWQTLLAWLECEECNEGELERVVKLGKVVVPSLAATLRGGPSPAKRESYRRHLLRTYDELQSYGKTHPKNRIKMSREDYVKLYMGNYVSLYRVRSATALGAIGGSEAKQALEQARQLKLRDDAKLAVERALEELR